ncbi:hypothetical protein YTPLAS72_21430 [Nitrospira sp.]|nr:hypothetical protein YTPLAS72_21430 [Nitrospira sp.]
MLGGMACGPFVKGFQSELIGHRFQECGSVSVGIGTGDRVHKSVPVFLAQVIAVEIWDSLEYGISAESSVEGRQFKPKGHAYKIEPPGFWDRPLSWMNGRVCEKIFQPNPKSCNNLFWLTSREAMEKNSRVDFSKRQGLRSICMCWTQR